MFDPDQRSSGGKVDLLKDRYQSPIRGAGQFRLNFCPFGTGVSPVKPLQRHTPIINTTRNQISKNLKSISLRLIAFRTVITSTECTSPDRTGLTVPLPQSGKDFNQVFKRHLNHFSFVHLSLSLNSKNNKKQTSRETNKNIVLVFSRQIAIRVCGYYMCISPSYTASQPQPRTAQAVNQQQTGTYFS
jgi:hypothetical protein